MPIPSRDRMSRPVDISTLYQGAARKVDLIVDQPGLIWNGLSGNRPRNASRGVPILRGRAVGVRVAGRGRLVLGQENRVPGVIGQRSGGGRGRIGQGTPGLRNNGGQGWGINWPSWYQRRPLQDISALLEAVERRRAELSQTRPAQQAENAEVQLEENAEVQQEGTNAEPLQTSTTELEQEIGSQTPLPTIFAKPHFSPGSQSWKITPKNVNFELSSDFLTPQRRLLNSIEKVREFWLEDQKRIQRTPAAKKAERERRVRTLMTMR